MCSVFFVVVVFCLFFIFIFCLFFLIFVFVFVFFYVLGNVFRTRLVRSEQGTLRSAGDRLPWLQNA